MVRQRRTEKEDQKQEEEEVEEEAVRGVAQQPRTISRRNLQSMVIGLIGAALTLGAYSQTMVSPTQCIAVGLCILFFGLLVSEGFISL